MAVQVASDVFSLSDSVLSDRLQFIEEIGYGNWGSVWACKPKLKSTSRSRDAQKTRDSNNKVAVKLVHRSKTRTTAARVRSLWNEMKIVRSLLHDPHPSIIQFHSFIITPSYVLITMTLLSNLIPVEVDESKAKGWFQSLLSAVLHLHSRGIVHNDIKPANVMLSEANVPIIIDFGFAEKYDPNETGAFQSNLSYGTPEYLAPERAGGQLHDTCKADVWALGVTLFEILVGRTPFEYGNGEKFSSAEELQRYWSRTNRGKWVGNWKLSKPVERMLKRMVTPNVASRYTASEAISDPYWRLTELTLHQRPTNAARSPASFTFDKLREMPLWSSRHQDEDKENIGVSAPSPARYKAPEDAGLNARQPSFPARGKRRFLFETGLPNVKGFPSARRPATASQTKEQTLNPSSDIPKRPRRPLVALPFARANRSAVEEDPSEAIQVVPRTPEDTIDSPRENTQEQNKVKRRVLEWEREKERLREMERLREWEEEREMEHEMARIECGQEWVWLDKDEQDLVSSGSDTSPSSDLTGGRRSRFGSVHALKNVKASLGKTIYTVAQLAGRITPRSFSAEESEGDEYNCESVEDDASLAEVHPSPPLACPAVTSGQLDADNEPDRMALWMRNVEQVVEEACQAFASAHKEQDPPTPLPLTPSPRLASSNRGCKELPGQSRTTSRAFSGQSEPSLNNSVNLAPVDPPTMECGASVARALLSEPPIEATFESHFIRSGGSLAHRRERSHTHGDIFDGHIPSPGELEPKLTQAVTHPIIAHRLSTLLDQHQCSASAASADAYEFASSGMQLASCPREVGGGDGPDTPACHRRQGVYDRFVSATTGLRWVGRRHQSDSSSPVFRGDKRNAYASPRSRIPHSFVSACRARPTTPPISKTDRRNTLSVEAVGGVAIEGPTPKVVGISSTAFVRRAIKAIAVKTVSRRD